MHPSQPSKPNSTLTSGELSARAVVLFCTLITFISTFKFGWVYDDVPQIAQNQLLQWTHMRFLLTHHLWASAAGTDGRFYRPLLTLWFLINKSLFGLNPHAFHVTTVLTHLAATALAFVVARNLLKDAGAAIFAAAIFGLHPLQAESASWISAVNDPLAAILCFSSFLMYRKARSETGSPELSWALGGILFLLALFTKEVSIVLPGIILVDLWAGIDGNRNSNVSPTSSTRGSTRASWLPAILTYVPVAIFWLAVRFWILGTSAVTSSSAPWRAYLLSIPKIVLFNLYRIVLPLHLSPHYDLRLIESVASPQFVFTALVLLVLALSALVAARRNPRLWIAFAWLILPMLPTLNLRWMNEDDFVHDRYLYMSLLGVAILAASAYAWIRKELPQQPLVRPLAASLAVLLGFASAIQSQFWATDVTLFSRAVAMAPNSEWAQLNYGSALSAQGKYSDAAPHFVQSYALKPGWRAADFAAFSYQQSGDLPLAERWFSIALQANPLLANAWFGLAQIRLAEQRPQEAVPYLKKALEIEPAADGYHYALGTALEQLGQRSDAIEEYKTELTLHPYQTGAKKALDRLQSELTDR